MTKKLLFCASLVGSVVALAGLPAHASERGVFRIGGIVHTVCRLDFGGNGPVQDGRIISLGRFTQLCNAGAGYRIIMQHPLEMAGAMLAIDGRMVRLSNGNETVIVDETRPAFKVSDVQLDMGDSNIPVHSLSFRIEPKGATY